MLKSLTLDQYEVIRTIGVGSFSHVNLCFHTPTEIYCTLKVMNKRLLIELNQIEHVQNEREILELIQHPNVVRMYGTFQDDEFVYIMMEYIPGGEVFSHLRTLQTFELDVVRFYAGEILLVFEALHSRQIVYRDLKPENLLFDQEGHIKFIDFGFAKRLSDDRTYTLCGTPEYLAPEIIRGEGSSYASDWWAFGILIYEMLVGVTPFFNPNENEMYQSICRGELTYPEKLDPITVDLLSSLFQIDTTKRLGCTSIDSDEIKRHRWFEGVDWNKMIEHKYQPPLMPVVNDDGDSSNFADYTDQIPQYEPLDESMKSVSFNMF